ncbi:rRNA-processing protein UTP23 homolog [Mizuhopecten yessoensis]|uniref:rRNA-processing protein UTP23 homolog n=1 Tax=Mizuhopecten yessoensis TaxID=6573 RepID=UPI000B45E4E4|nr:rRNA-processing protein UTP23 homolog [Mizuhopecten yessoensis]
MRKRQKRVRKLISFYKNNFGLKTPYNVLVDGTFCKSALAFKVNINDQMPRYLEGEVNIVTTECVKEECAAFGTLLYGPLKILRQFDVQHCKHKKPVKAARCMTSVVKNSRDKQLMIATQDHELREELREKHPGVPLLFVAYNAINMESPTELSKGTADKELQARMAPSEHQMEVLKKLKVQAFGEEPVKKKFKRKGPKGPNPLSCQKSKKGEKTKAKKAKKTFLENAVNKRKRRKTNRVKTSDNSALGDQLKAAVKS